MPGMVTTSRPYKPVVRKAVMTITPADAAAAGYPTQYGTWTWEYTYNGMETTTSYRSGGKYDSLDLSSKQILLDAEEDYYRSLGDTGHEFDSVKKWWVLDPTIHTFVSPNGSIYTGPISGTGAIVAPIYASTSTAAAFPSLPDVSASLGSKAVANVAPNLPRASILEAIIDIFQGIELKWPTTLLTEEAWKALVGGLRKGKTLSSLGSAAGSEFLNLVYGVTPSINDFQQLFMSVSKCAPLIRAYAKAANKPLHRRYRFPQTRTNVISAAASAAIQNLTIPCSTTGGVWTSHGSQVVAPSSAVVGYSFFSNYDRLSSQNLSYKTYSTTTVDSWFSGSFLYSLPIGNDVLSRFDRYATYANYLLGLDLTPDLLWDLAPWSWLADWFFDVTDLLKSSTAFSQYGLVMKFGYLMQRSRTQISADYTYTSTKNNLFVNGSRYTPTSATVVERKQRMRANPFGFGVADSSLSSSQWTILAALGLTKAPGKRW